MTAMDPSKAKVYIVRPTKLGFAVGVKVTVNDVFMGKTKGGRFMEMDLEPGHYTIVSKAENASIQELTVEAGREYFLKQHIFPGFWKARNKLDIIDENQGKLDLQQCKPLKK